MAQKQVSKASLVGLFGESARQIEKYVQEGMPCTGSGRDRRFPWPEVRNWRDDRVRRLEREKVERGQPTDIDEAKRRKEVALAEKAELEVAQLRGDLIPLDLHEQRVEALAVMLAAQVKGLDRYIADVQRATSAAEAKAALDRISDALLLACQGVADDLMPPDDVSEDADAAA